MNTQLAINLLTGNSNNLSNALAALGLLSNGETISSLQLKVKESIETAFEKHQQLSSNLDTVEGKLGQIENELSLALSNQAIEQVRLANLQKQQNELEITIQSLQDRKQIISANGDSKKTEIEAEIKAIKANIAITETEVVALQQQIVDGLTLVASYESFVQQAQTSQEQANYHNQYVQKWVKVGEKKKRSGGHDDIYDWVTDTEQVNLRDSFQQQANQFNEQAASILGQVDSFKESLPVLEETKNIKTDQVWLYYHELEAKNNLLSFASNQNGNDLALLDLQLSQSQTDLMQLKDADIPSQKVIVDSTTQRVTQVQSELDQFKTQKVSAQQDLDTFVENNKELLTTDLSLNLLQDSITQVQVKITSLQGDLAQPNQSTDILNGLTQTLGLEQGKLEKLKQQYQLLALEALEVNQGRLESLNGQLAAETSTNNAVQVNTIGGYVALLPQFVQQLTELSDVWAENLKDNHQFTVDVNNLFQLNLTDFEGIAGYIEDNLADPYSDYVLNGIQLDEAIAIQDAQVKYQDALAKTVDDLGENIELQKKSVEQTELLSTQLTHISQLISFKNQYATLQNDYAIFNQQWQSLSTDYNEKLSISQQKEQQLAQAQQAYNDRTEAISEFISIDHNFGIRLISSLSVLNQQITNAQQELQTAQINENSAFQSFQDFKPQRLPLDDRFNQLSPLVVNELAKEITYETQDLTVHIDLPNDLQEQWIETSLQKYIQQKESNITGYLNGLNQGDTFYKLRLESIIDALENLRLEITHLTLQTAKNPDKVQNFLQEYEAGDKTATTLQTLRDKYYPELNQAITLAKLQTQINKEISQSQQQIEGLKADITQKQAQSAAALSQADWYEQQAATHWQLSRKAGPTWTEERKAKGKSGSSKTITVTHVDHDWIIWDTYTKQATSLREQSANLLKGIATDTTNQNTATDILTQWQAASAVADQTALSQADLIALLNQLDANRQLNGDKKQQIADWETLLPTLQSQLQQAIQDAEIAKNNVTQEWTEYETSQDDYQTALADVFTRRAELQSQGQILLQEINNVDEWVKQQNTLLSDEITQVATLITELKTQRDNIPDLENDAQTVTTLQVLLDESIQLLTQKQIVLSAEQSTFTQKQTLLETQKKVIETQYELLDAYLENPDKDTSNLEKLLTDTRVTLAEIQKLAEKAEASSNALTAVIEDVQVSLLLQNDKYLSAIKDKQETLQELLQATELKENDTLKATQKQLELNDLQTQLLGILKQANDAGSQEAAKLLEVASYNDFATVAELYHRDYQDLATDQGGSCSGGIARPEDIQLANYYYGEMLKYRQLKSEAEQQVTQFTQLRTQAESQAAALQEQQTLAAQELALLQQSIGNNQDQINAKQEELAIAQFRVDALSQLRNWTEQTQVQLLSVEQLNLAQAQLEQEIAKNRQYLIDDAVTAQLNKQRLDIERDRQIAIVKLEQLNQLKTEEALQTAINNLRSDLGVNPIAEIIQLADYKGQLAGILAEIEDLKQTQPSLPEATKTLLDNTIQDIHTALQGKETLIIQDNLLKSANALIEQSNILKADVAKLQQEEQRYLDLLTQSQTDLQGATKVLYDEIQKSGALDSEKTLLNAQNLEILYEIGYAKGAVDLSSDLAKQAKEILEQVIAGRIEERKAREKAAFNEIFGTVTLVISAVAAVLTAGASLAVNAATTGLSGAAATAAAANATVLGVSVSTISSIATTLKTISSTLSIVQAAYNKDWSTVIFKVGLSFADGLKDIAGLSSNTVNTLKTSLNTAYAAYKGGDSIGTLLGAIQGIGAIAADGVDLSDLSQVSNLKTFLITTSQISTVVHAGIQAIEDGNILQGIQALGQSLGTISKNFGLGLEEATKAKLEDLTGLEWQKLDQIIDLGGNAYNAITNKDWIDLVKAIGGTVKIIDEDFALEIDNQGQTALKTLTGLEWSEFEKIVDASQTLRVAIKAKNITDISAALNDLANVWVTDDELNNKLVTAFGLDWQDLTDIAKTGDILIPAIRNDNTEAWVKATGDFLTTWESNAAFQTKLQDTTNLEWTEFKQLVAIGQTVSLAVDQRSINAWVDALKTTLDWALQDTSFDNQKVNQIISTAQQTNNTSSWVAAVDQLLGVAEDATALRNKLGEITGVTWAEFKQIINAGQAIATAIDDGNFTNWRDALKTTLNIWVDDVTLQQQIETTTGLKWEQLTRIGSTYEAVRQADEGGDATSWFKAADQILILWEKDTTLQNQVKTLTNLDWQELKDLVAIGKTIDTAIDQKTYDAWRDALKQTVNFWVTDQTLNQSLESLIGLNWNQLDKIGQASDALYKAYGKADKIIDQALESNNYQDWLNGIKDVYQLWKDDPILRQKATDAGKVIWSEVEGIFKAENTLDTKNRRETIQTNIQDTISTIETTFQQKLESSIGLSWTQVKAVAQSGQIIAKAIADNQTEQWIQASDEILSIWEKDSQLREVLKDKYNIDWTNIKASVGSGQNLAKAVQANTVPAWGTALQNIINIWTETTTLTPQQQDKLQQTNNLVNQVKASNNSQDWLAVTNQVIDLWKDETAFQIQLQQNNQLSWQHISNSVKSGQVLALDQNGLEQWLGNLKNVVEIWKSDPEIKTIVENISDLNWQSLSNAINYNSVTANFINGDDNNNNFVGTAENDYIDAKNGNDYLDGGIGDDLMIGGTGNDILVGGFGSDYLTGGTGNDRFVFASLGEGIDTITDFSSTDDVLVVQTLLASLNYTGTNPITDGYIRGINSGSNTLVQVDTDGIGVSYSFSTLVTLNNFSASNFSQNNLIF
jgi:Ca2+-binding RTX toxin-like protein